MERISAASAMEWSIELEKALRSKKPGQAIEGIQRIGKRIQEWSKEPKPTVAVYNMFGLVPGEDRLFANTILLRLADAFRFGDRETRVSIVKVFLLELKSRDNKKMKGRLYRGILSKERVQNHVELLKRVKLVFDTGDVESKALALALFGCWAPFARDSAHIRYLILSSMISSDVLQAQASLFAAGCFCELAGDFVPVVLEMLVNMVTSSETLLTIRLAGTRVFAKMGPSYSVASRAYKTGLNLLDSLEEDLVVTMLVSLTKLASKSTLLLLEQVDLLLLFLSQEKDLRLQATALRCLHFIFMRGGVYSSVSALGIKTLSRIVDEADLPLSMQCDALQILHKVISESNLLSNDLAYAESFIMSKSLLAIHVLADLSMKLSRRAEMGSGGNSFSPLLTRTISIIIDRVILVVKPLLVLCQAGAGALQEVQSLLSLLLSLVREHPHLGVSVLDKVRLFIEYLVDVHEVTLVEREFFTLDCAKKLLTERDNWSAYKAGTFAACQGAWITAAFVFEQLTSKAQSGSCSCWLKSLTQFAQTESKFQFYPITQWGFSLADWSKINEFPVMLFQDISNELGRGAVENINEPNYTEMLLQAYHGLCSSRKTLESIVTSNKSFCFQRWFLAIRVELLGTMENVVKVLGIGVQPKDNFHESRSQRLNISGEERYILDVCNYVVAGIVALKEEANRKKNEEILSQVTKDGFQLLLNTIMKWMRIPFRVPTYFFKIRPCIGSELFVFNADTRNSNHLSILPGFNLSLNLCLQLRNLPPDLPFGVTRSYCVLYSSMSFQDSKENGETKGQFLWENRTLDSDNLIRMNEKLLHHVTECSTKKTSNSKRGREKDIDSDEIITGFACFDLIDARKGFSNCLLDVSRFPVGSYRIKWQSCCIDSQGSYWSLLPLNAGPVFTVQKPTAV
ncbi:C1ORF73 PROTEIN [Salix viminalis]|uniref:C1ORF73 PROTEIN n=1 Tax=Salix viminalis TaxID=40686 RepID=A0A9Q0SDP3_SALVM|nr:C1ORF73 PROTEIN [Salix viminalis]